MLRTPRLELRPVDDPALYELIEVAEQGIHPADEMPFAVEWTDALSITDVGRSSEEPARR